MKRSQDVLEFAVDVGEMMLRFGGEIYRVEDTMYRVLETFEIEKADVYVLSNGIFASVRGNEGKCYSLVRQVPLEAVNLRGISALNQLSRDVVAGVYDLEEAKEKLVEVRRIEVETDGMLCLSCGIGCGAYALLQGGRWIEGVGAFLVGMGLQIALRWMGRRMVGRMTRCIWGSLLVTAMSLLLVGLGMPISQDKVIISATLPLFPGLAFIVSIRDFFNGDHLSGVIHLADVLLSTLCIAAGVGVMSVFLQAVR